MCSLSVFLFLQLTFTLLWFVLAEKISTILVLLSCEVFLFFQFPGPFCDNIQCLSYKPNEKARAIFFQALIWKCFKSVNFNTSSELNIADDTTRLHRNPYIYKSIKTATNCPFSSGIDKFSLCWAHHSFCMESSFREPLIWTLLPSILMRHHLV